MADRVGAVSVPTAPLIIIRDRVPGGVPFSSVQFSLSVQSKNQPFSSVPCGPKPHLRGPGTNITPSHRHLLCEVERIWRIALVLYPFPQRPWSSPEIGFPAASHSVQFFQSFQFSVSVQSKNRAFPPAPYRPQPHLRGPGKNITPSHRHLLCEMVRIWRIALALYPFPQRPWSSPETGFPAVSHSVQSLSFTFSLPVFQFRLRTRPFHRLPMARSRTSESRGRT